MLRKIKVLSNKGFTLIEALVTLAIIGVVASIVFPMLIMNNKVSASQLREFGQRNEIRVTAAYLNDDIRYAKEVVVSDKHLEIINNKGKVIEYYVKQDSEDEKYLVRETESLNKFNYIKDVKFTLLNDKLVSVRLITDIENNKSIEFKITRLDFKLVREPGDDIEDDLYNYIKMNNVFLYSSNLSVSGGTSVNMSSNNEGTIMIDNSSKSDLIFGGNNNISMKNIYINKPSNKISFNSSTKLGNLGVTEEVIIK